MKTPLEISTQDMIAAMDKADRLECEVLRQALHCGTTSCQWLMATGVYNSIISRSPDSFRSEEQAGFSDF